MLSMTSHQGALNVEVKGKEMLAFEFSSAGGKVILEVRQTKGRKVTMKLLSCSNCLASKSELKHVNKKEEDDIQKRPCGVST